MSIYFLLVLDSGRNAESFFVSADIADVWKGMVNYMILSIIQYYYIGVMASLFLLFFIVEKNSFGWEINRWFILAAFCTLLLSFTDAADTVLAAKPYPTNARTFFAACGYVLRPAVAYLTVQIVIRNTSRSLKWLISIPLAIDLFISFSALWSDMAFGYTAENRFYRGSLGVTPFIVGTFYGVLLVASTFWFVHSSQREEGIFALLIALISGMGTILESRHKLHGILPSSLAVCLGFYYLSFHTYQNDRDVLTGVLLRRKFYQDAGKWGSTVTGVVSIDLNGLKELNDHYGHDEGDKAIRTLSACVRHVLPKKASFYRTGGDEFMMLCRKMSEKDIAEMIRQIRHEMKQTEYSCAIGYAMFDFDKGLEEACHRADKNMYENKIQIKGEKYRHKYINLS